MNNLLFVFDFDGVLFDSNLETCLTAYNTNVNQLITDLEQLPENFEDLFCLNRCRAKNAGDMVALAKWAIENLEFEKRTLSREEFQEKVAVSDSINKEFTLSFFEWRKKFLVADREKWLSLMKPYEDIVNFLNSLPVSPLIITYKNREAVLELCNFYGLKIEEEKLFSGDNNVKKIENFNKLRESYPAKKYVFVDDAIKNLVELRKNLSFKVEYIYASWGYGAKDDLDFAKENKFLVCSENELIQRMKKELIF